jgi:hypothetical protein
VIWSGRADLNRGPPAPKAGGLPKTTVLFSTFPLKQNGLDEIIICGWLWANVPICLLGGHKSWHNRVTRTPTSTQFRLGTLCSHVYRNIAVHSTLRLT